MRIGQAAKVQHFDCCKPGFESPMRNCCRNTTKVIQEGEEDLMIILYDPIFGFGRMIVFYLIDWVTTSTKTLTKVSKDLRNRSAFPVPANLTRHEITCKSADLDDKDKENTQNI